MADETFERVAQAARQRGHRGRSDAYRWLRARHGRLSRLLARHDPPWAVVAAEMARAGIIGGRGRPVTARALARIWRRVCADAAAAARPTRPRPPAAPAGWRPTPVLASAPVAPPHPNMPQVPGHPGSPGQARAGPPVTARATDGVEDRIAAMRREINERSGR